MVAPFSNGRMPGKSGLTLSHAPQAFFNTQGKLVSSTQRAKTFADYLANKIWFSPQDPPVTPHSTLDHWIPLTPLLPCKILTTLSANLSPAKPQVQMIFQARFTNTRNSF